jgi:hypothetical protein
LFESPHAQIHFTSPPTSIFIGALAVRLTILAIAGSPQGDVTLRRD